MPKKAVSKKKKKGTVPKKKPAIKVVKKIAIKPIGKVTHYFTSIKVAIVKFKRPVGVGEIVRFEGATTKFSMKIVSMQFDHVAVKVAKKNQQMGIKVTKRVREGDSVFEGE